MSRSYTLKVRLTTDEKERLQYEALKREISMSEVIQDYIKQLPKPKNPAA